MTGPNYGVPVEIMDKAYKVRNIIQHSLPPMVRVWPPYLSYDSVRFRVKYKTMPVFFAELTYNQIVKMPVEESAMFTMLHLTKQMLERIDNHDVSTD